MGENQGNEEQLYKLLIYVRAMSGIKSFLLICNFVINIIINSETCQWIFYNFIQVSPFFFSNLSTKWVMQFDDALNDNERCNDVKCKNAT